MNLFISIIALLRRTQSWLAVAGKSSYLTHGNDLHVGRGSTLWAPKQLSIGNNRYKIQNLGFINYSDEGLISFIENRIRSFNSAAHHLGTTRMSNNPKLGVVDSNCKVHGMNNLYITGSSVFPTGGHVNPTLTIIALAIRLGNYLKNL